MAVETEREVWCGGPYAEADEEPCQGRVNPGGRSKHRFALHMGKPCIHRF